MIDFLLAVPGKLTTIINYLNTNLAAARTARIENLDATTSSRAAAATALSAAVWTQAHADKVALILRDPTARIPIESGIIVGAQISNTSLTYAAIVNYSGAGVLNQAWGSGASAAGFMRITIDGVLVLPETLIGTSDTYLVGAFGGLDQIPFYTSLLVEGRTSNTASTAYFYTKYRKTP